VLTDLPKPDHMVCTPVIAPLAFCGHQRPPHEPGSPSPAGYRDTKRMGELNAVFSGIPASSAASMVNILNVEPAW
jgi:hypothetical protein